jgi:hypothetical protein
MILETLLVGGGALAAWFARNTAPVRAVTNTVKNRFTRTKFGQSMILGSAEDNIRAEYESEKQTLRNDKASLSVDKSLLKKLEDEIEFLDFACNDESLSTEERESYKQELGIKRSQHTISLQGITQKESLIKNREESLKLYERTTLKERLAQAQIAQIVFKHNNEIEEYQKNLDKISVMGHGTMTTDVVSRYTGHSDLSVNNNIVNRFEMKEKYRKFKEQQKGN